MIPHLYKEYKHLLLALKTEIAEGKKARSATGTASIICAQQLSSAITPRRKEMNGRSIINRRNGHTSKECVSQSDNKTIGYKEGITTGFDPFVAHQMTMNNPTNSTNNHCAAKLDHL